MKTVFATTLFGLSTLTTAADWDYSDNGGDWSTEACAYGLSQSPIDISTATVTSGRYIANFGYKGETLNAYNNGYTINYRPDGRALEVVDHASKKLEKFTLVQFHLHNGAEHLIDGTRHALEAHFVHANKAFIHNQPGGRLAVIGVFLEPSNTPNQFWENLLLKVPSRAGQSLNKITSNNYFELLPRQLDAYTYEGSLTTPTPDCMEIVNWIVMKTPVGVSLAAINSFSKSQKHIQTYRDTHSLNGRTITLGELGGTNNP